MLPVAIFHSFSDDQGSMEGGASRHAQCSGSSLTSHRFVWGRHIPIVSTGLIYLRTWIVDLHGKCRYAGMPYMDFMGCRNTKIVEVFASFGHKKPLILVELFSELRIMGVYWGLLPDPMVSSVNSPQHGGLISKGTASIGERVLHDVLAWKPTSWTRNWGETTGHYLPLLLGKYLIRLETTYISGVYKTLVRPFVLSFRAVCNDTIHMIVEFILQTDPCYQTIS